MLNFLSSALAATLDYPPPHCGIDPMLDKINLDSKAALLWISKVRGYDHVCSGWSAQRRKKHTNLSYEATIDPAFLISDHC